MPNLCECRRWLSMIVQVDTMRNIRLGWMRNMWDSNRCLDALSANPCSVPGMGHTHLSRRICAKLRCWCLFSQSFCTSWANTRRDSLRSQLLLFLLSSASINNPKYDNSIILITSIEAILVFVVRRQCIAIGVAKPLQIRNVSHTKFPEQQSIYRSREANHPLKQPNDSRREANICVV